MPDESVQQLAEQVAQGADAEEQLAGLLWDTIYRTASWYGLEHDERVDVVHETISIMLTKLRTRQFRGEAALETFVLRIAQNLCSTRRKKSKTRPREDHIPGDTQRIEAGEAATLITPPYADPMQSAKASERVELLKEGVEHALTGREEWAIFQLLLKGFTRTEISEMLTIPLGRVDSKIHRSKKKIRKYLHQRLKHP